MKYTLALSLDIPVVDEIDKIRGIVSRSAFINYLLKDALKKEIRIEVQNGTSRL